MIGKDLYSVEEVADRLGLHVRTVRGYIRTGRLRAVRIGKQYRVHARDLTAFTGDSAPATREIAVEVTSVVQVDGVDRATADRLGTLAVAAAYGEPDLGRPLRVQTSYEGERARMTIVLIGGAADTAGLVQLLDAVVDDAGAVVAEGGADA
ncbi:helix-turn-helix domain-containing protein [Natronosporangium hydrolyticum]|uniref:helix-turn-helix domain-containing protein n=1 Tax=Natronosporangium hydrolyticum TaxID=2811111 RepID=UPI0030840E8D